MQKSNIEWCTHTWNPVSGCSKVSAGCKNCYAERHAKRFWGERKFADVRIHPEKLSEPLRRKKPSVVFVNSMSDLFHDDIPAQFISSLFDLMEACQQHIFLILTKRPGRMREIFHSRKIRLNAKLGNVWFGVSIEDQASANERVPKLWTLPTKNLFLSAEPLLGEVNLAKWLDQIKWVIAGGESGTGARPTHPDWARSIRNQCESAHVPFFFKQNGERHSSGYRVTKAQAGRLLDGREHLEYPEAIARIKCMI